MDLVPPLEPGSDIPRIVIRLTDITTTPASGLTYTDDQYITIKRFKNGGTTLTAIKAGEVYSIAASVLNFDETILTPTPNMFEVKVTLAQWVPVPPGFSLITQNHEGITYETICYQPVVIFSVYVHRMYRRG